MKRQQIRKALVIISFLLFPITMWYLSPYLIIMGVSRGIISGSFILFGLLFLSSFHVGRAFCGWICPASGLGEVCSMVQNKPVRQGNWIKYLIWAPWLILIVLITIKAGGLQTIDPLFQTTYGISIAQPQSYIIFYTVIGLVVILAFTVGRRSFCHHVCWMAPFMIIGTKIRNIFKWPALHLAISPEKCAHCKKCTEQCPMSIEVEASINNGSINTSDCILCGGCTDICPNGAIRFSWKSRQ